MRLQCTLGAILIIFILCVHCDDEANNNEIKKFYVPSAPQNLTAHRVSDDEIYLSWAPPTTFTLHVPREPPQSLPDAPPPTPSDQQADQPADLFLETSNVGTPLSKEYQSSYRDWYSNEKKIENEYTSDVLSDAVRAKRDAYTHRHRKRRQGVSSNDTKIETEVKDPKKPQIAIPQAVTRIGYVLYYEQGLLRKDTPIIKMVPSSKDVKTTSVFPSDLGMDDYARGAKNLTLLNTAGVPAKVVGFRLKNLKSFTPYKIWVRAFYNFSLERVKSSDLLERLGPRSEPLYVLSDVRPPSPPIVLNLTCDQENGVLYLQWRQPMTFDNNLDQYVVTLRKVPEHQPRMRLKLVTHKDDIETTISVDLELRNMSQYEVKIAAASLSVARPNTFINGTESAPEEVSSSLCTAVLAARAPQRDLSSLALITLAPVALAAAAAIVLYCRCRSRLSKCISAAYSYLEEGGERGARAPLNAHKKPAATVPHVTGGVVVGGALTTESRVRVPRMSVAPHAALTRDLFVTHVQRLHADSDLGFSKEYEIVVSKSAALGHTSHHSHRAENRLKNRYLNITAYDHSRVCVSSGGRCGAAGCVGGAGTPGGGAGAPGGPAGAPGGGAGAPLCDYVNANFIDGMLPEIDEERKKYIKRKLEKRARPQRQPSVKPAKPPPNLTEGIESAFLNIEFSGIVEWERDGDCSSDDDDDDDPELDNVYVDIDGTRTQVKLEWLVWRRRYIATQGPTPSTLDSFWRMIWQHRVHTLVMITNLVERGRRKCDMYWPAAVAGSCEYGGVRVTLLHEDVRAAYTVRHLRVQRDDGSDASRVVRQYHYTVWPDHGTPRAPLALLPFVRAAAAAAPPPSSSLSPSGVEEPPPPAAHQLVHCSAGVGRTGTYIVLDAQLNQLKLTGTLSPLGFLCRARTQRNHLVQTEEQYIFVHDSLLEHVRAGNTEVEFSKVREYFVKLLQPITEDELAVLDLKPTKAKSVNDLTNGFDQDTASMKSKSERTDLQNGDGSEMSMKTDDLSESVKENGDAESQEEKLVNGDEGEVEQEGVYDLAPRSTDTYSKKMAEYNSMSEQEKEEIRKANRMENYAILERMRSLSNRTQRYEGPPPTNLLEKQYFLMRRSCAEASAHALTPHNARKNPPGATLPSDAARVLLLPKPGQEGSEYINASWVCGRRRLREYCVGPAPPRPGAPGAPGARGTPGTTGTQPDTGPVPGAGEPWRLLWDHCAQLVLALYSNDCEVFWPTEEETELFVANFRASFVSKDMYVAYRKKDRKPPTEPPSPEKNPEIKPEINGHRRTESGECADDERLIPDNSPVHDTEPAYRFDRTELRLERLSTGSKDLSARKSIANGDLFSSLSDRKNGPKSPKSPSKMSLKNFKLSSPTKFKFPEWGSRVAGSPPDTAPPPPPVPPALSVEEEADLRRPVYYFEKVTTVPEDVPSDRIIEVTNVSIHSLQDDYQLSVKFIRCHDWLEGDTTSYTAGKSEENEYIRAVLEAQSESEMDEAIDRLTEPYKDSFALIEFIAGCQMEYKNGPVVVLDKYGSWKAMSFCALSAACGGARDPHARDPAAPYRAPDDRTADLYCWGALGAHARAVATPTGPLGLSGSTPQPLSLPALLAQYAALVRYGDALCPR